MVTAELAAALPVLLLVLGVALAAVGVAGARVRLHDAAREAARAAGRDPTASSARLAAGSVPGARMSVQRATDRVVVVMSADIHPLGGWLPTVRLTERAVAAVEPTGESP